MSRCWRAMPAQRHGSPARWTPLASVRRTHSPSVRRPATTLPWRLLTRWQRWSLGFSYAVAIQSWRGAEPTMDVVWHAALTSGSAALVTLALLPWSAAIVARGSIASLLKDR